MAFDTSQLVDYAWSDIALAAKQAMMSAALGGATLTMPGGKMIGRISIEDASKLYSLAQEMIALEASGPEGYGNVLVRLNPSS